MTATVQLRCRRCHIEYEGQLTVYAPVTTLDEAALRIPGAPCWHQCDAGHVGVADLVGVVLQEEEQ